MTINKDEYFAVFSNHLRMTVQTLYFNQVAFADTKLKYKCQN